MCVANYIFSVSICFLNSTSKKKVNKLNYLDNLQGLIFCKRFNFFIVVVYLELIFVEIINQIYADLGVFNAKLSDVIFKKYSILFKKKYKFIE